MSAGTAPLLERFCLKFHAAEPDGVDLAAAIPVFHRWIQSKRLAGLLIDVVDYRHVPDGPGVVLIGHEADYFLDRAEGPLGLLCNRKRAGQGTDVGRLRSGLRHTLEACRALEQEPEFSDRGLRFLGNRLRLIANDRLAAPNDDSTLASVKPDVESVLGELYPGRDFRLERETGDPRSRFTLQAEAPQPVDVATLLERIG